MSKNSFGNITVLLVFLCIYATLFNTVSEAQTSSSFGRRKLFEEDKKSFQSIKQKKREQLRKSQDVPLKKEVKFRSPQVNIDQEKQKISGKDGVVVSYGGVQVQAKEAEVDLKTKDLIATGGASISQSEGSLAADEIRFNLDTETGSFKKAQFRAEEGGYLFEADELEKLSEFDYRMKQTQCTTCDCADGSKPWSFSVGDLDITQEGYAVVHDLTFRIMDVPVFYSPYFFFPAKTKRASGLLAPDLGFSRLNGFRYRQPIFMVLDDSSDLLAAPYIETATRTGSSLQFRKSFSKQHTLNTRWYFSDESARNGDLRGIVKTDLNDPRFDEQRHGGYYEQYWSSDRDALIPSSFLADIHYVSDDLFPREIVDNQVLPWTSQFATSTVALRSNLGDYLTGSVGAEYNQAIDGDRSVNDEAVLQRLPDLSLAGSRSFRIFGSNPYGLKLVTKGGVDATSFSRDVGVDGTRLNVKPGVAVPFHYQNYFYGAADVTAYETRYNLGNLTQPTSLADGTTFMPDSSPTRRTFVANYTMATDLERVFDVDPQGTLGEWTTLGRDSAGTELRRVKNIISPNLRYTYIPDISGQDDLPLFDSVDRIRQRSVFVYGINSALFGRFDNLGSSATLEELTPESQDLPELSYNSPFSDTSGQFKLDSGRFVAPGREVRKLLNFSVQQAFDIIEQQDDSDPARGAFSDVGFRLDATPSSSFLVGFDGNVRPQDGSLSSIGFTTMVRSDRGDNVGARYSFVNPLIYSGDTKLYEPNISQVEANLELVLADRLRFGAYGRYDGTNSSWIEDSLAFRFLSSCDCWFVDLGYFNRSNPDNESFQVRFSLLGMGGLNQNLLRQKPGNSSSLSQ